MKLLIKLFLSIAGLLTAMVCHGNQVDNVSSVVNSSIAKQGVEATRLSYYQENPMFWNMVAFERVSIDNIFVFTKDGQYEISYSNLTVMYDIFDRNFSKNSIYNGHHQDLLRDLRNNFRENKISRRLTVDLDEDLQEVIHKYSSSEIVEKQPEIRRDFVKLLVEKYKKYGVMITKVYFSPVTKTQL
jgi:hypothetical protein